MGSLEDSTIAAADASVIHLKSLTEVLEERLRQQAQNSFQPRLGKNDYILGTPREANTSPRHRASPPGSPTLFPNTHHIHGIHLVGPLHAKPSSPWLLPASSAQAKAEPTLVSAPKQGRGSPSLSSPTGLRSPQQTVKATPTTWPPPIMDLDPHNPFNSRLMLSLGVPSKPPTRKYPMLGQVRYREMQAIAEAAHTHEKSKFMADMAAMDDEINAWVGDFKYEVQAPGAALVIQCAWRARGPRLLFNRYMDLRWASLARVLASHLLPWASLARANLHARTSRARRVLLAWHEMGVLTTTYFSKVLSRLSLSIEVTGANPTKMWRLCTRPGSPQWQARIGKGPIIAGVLARQVPFRTLKLYFMRWLTDVQKRNEQRTRAAAVLAALEGRRQKEQLHAALRFWFRYSLVKVGERTNIAPPLFRPHMPEWDVWVWGHSRSQELATRVQMLHKTFHMRFFFSFWNHFTRRNIKMRTAWLSAAAMQIEDILRGVMSALKSNWRAACVLKKLKAKCFMCWRLLGERNKEVRTIARAVQESSRRCLLLMSMRMMKRWAAASRVMSAAGHIKVMSRRSALMGCMYAMTGDLLHMWQSLCWSRWRNWTLGRIRMKSMIGLHIHRSNMRNVELVLKGWRKLTEIMAEERRAHKEVFEAALYEGIFPLPRRQDSEYDIVVTLADYPMTCPWRPLQNHGNVMKGEDLHFKSSIERSVRHLRELRGRFSWSGTDRKLFIEVYKRPLPSSQLMNWVDSNNPVSLVWRTLPQQDPWFWQRVLGLLFSDEPHPEGIENLVVQHELPYYDECLIARRKARAMTTWLDPDEVADQLDIDPSATRRETATTDDGNAGSQGPVARLGNSYTKVMVLNGKGEEMRMGSAQNAWEMDLDDEAAVAMYRLAEAEELLETSACMLLDLHSGCLEDLYAVLQERVGKPALLQGDLLTWLLEPAQAADASLLASLVSHRNNRDRVISGALEMHERALQLHRSMPVFTLMHPGDDPWSRWKGIWDKMEEEELMGIDDDMELIHYERRLAKEAAEREAEEAAIREAEALSLLPIPVDPNDEDGGELDAKEQRRKKFAKNIKLQLELLGFNPDLINKSSTATAWTPAARAGGKSDLHFEALATPSGAASSAFANRASRITGKSRAATMVTADASLERSSSNSSLPGAAAPTAAGSSPSAGGVAGVSSLHGSISGPQGGYAPYNSAAQPQGSQLYPTESPKSFLLGGAQSPTSGPSWLRGSPNGSPSSKPTSPERASILAPQIWKPVTRAELMRALDKMTKTTLTSPPMPDLPRVIYTALGDPPPRAAGQAAEAGEGEVLEGQSARVSLSGGVAEGAEGEGKGQDEEATAEGGSGGGAAAADGEQAGTDDIVKEGSATAVELGGRRSEAANVLQPGGMKREQADGEEEDEVAPALLRGLSILREHSGAMDMISELGTSALKSARMSMAGVDQVQVAGSHFSDIFSAFNMAHAMDDVIGSDSDEGPLNLAALETVSESPSASTSEDEEDEDASISDNEDEAQGEAAAAEGAAAGTEDGARPGSQPADPQSEQGTPQLASRGGKRRVKEYVPFVVTAAQLNIFMGGYIRQGGRARIRTPPIDENRNPSKARPSSADLIDHDSKDHFYKVYSQERVKVPLPPELSLEGYSLSSGLQAAQEAVQARSAAIAADEELLEELRMFEQDLLALKRHMRQRRRASRLKKGVPSRYLSHFTRSLRDEFLSPAAAIARAATSPEPVPRLETTMSLKEDQLLAEYQDLLEKAEGEDGAALQAEQGDAAAGNSDLSSSPFSAPSGAMAMFKSTGAEAKQSGARHRPGTLRGGVPHLLHSTQPRGPEDDQTTAELDAWREVWGGKPYSGNESELRAINDVQRLLEKAAQEEWKQYEDTAAQLVDQLSNALAHPLSPGSTNSTPQDSQGQRDTPSSAQGDEGGLGASRPGSQPEAGRPPEEAEPSTPTQHLDSRSASFSSHPIPQPPVGARVMASATAPVVIAAATPQSQSGPTQHVTVPFPPILTKNGATFGPWEAARERRSPAPKAAMSPRSASISSPRRSHATEPRSQGATSSRAFSPSTAKTPLREALAKLDEELATSLDASALSGLSLGRYNGQMLDLMSRLVVAPLATKYLFWKKVKRLTSLRRHLREDRELAEHLRAVSWLSAVNLPSPGKAGQRGSRGTTAYSRPETSNEYRPPSIAHLLASAHDILGSAWSGTVEGSLVNGRASWVYRRQPGHDDADRLPPVDVRKLQPKPYHLMTSVPQLQQRFPLRPLRSTKQISKNLQAGTKHAVHRDGLEGEMEEDLDPGTLDSRRELSDLLRGRRWLRDDPWRLLTMDQQQLFQEKQLVDRLAKLSIDVYRDFLIRRSKALRCDHAGEGKGIPWGLTVPENAPELERATYVVSQNPYIRPNLSLPKVVQQSANFKPLKVVVQGKTEAPLPPVKGKERQVSARRPTWARHTFKAESLGHVVRVPSRVSHVQRSSMALERSSLKTDILYDSQGAGQWTTMSLTDQGFTEWKQEAYDSQMTEAESTIADVVVTGADNVSLPPIKRDWIETQSMRCVASADETDKSSELDLLKQAF